MNSGRGNCRAILVVCILLALVSCKYSGGPDTVQSTESALTKSISDAAHNAGNEGFYFLPPMVKPLPLFGGVFDPTLSPEVAISPLGVTFTMDSGHGSERVRLSLEEEQYIVNWHTKDFDLDAGETYRVTVSVEGTVLGYADVDLVESGSGLQDVDTGEFVALKIGRTLPIKFRIEEGALEPPPPPEFTVTESQVAVTSAEESNPRLGSDEAGTIVVYTSQSLQSDGSYIGDIYYQRIGSDGTLAGPAVLVSSGAEDDKFSDISGARIVYTAFESPTSILSDLMLYDISAGTAAPLLPGAATYLYRESRIDGSIVVWSQGENGSNEVWFHDIESISGSSYLLKGPTPSCNNVEIGSRYVVWEETEGTQKDITAYDRLTGTYVTVSADPGFDERLPATSGNFVVWQAEDEATGAMTIRMANLAVKPVTFSTIVDDGASVGRPSIDGDLVAFESDPAGNRDIYLYRISDGRIFPVTNDPADQFLANLRGNQVGYIDNRSGTYDIFVATFSLPPVE